MSWILFENLSKMDMFLTGTEEREEIEVEEEERPIGQIVLVDDPFTVEREERGRERAAGRTRRADLDKRRHSMVEIYI